MSSDSLSSIASQTPFVQMEAPSQIIPVAVHPELPAEALPGLVGAIVRECTRNSESDPAAVLFTLLTWFGVHVGSGIYVQVGETQHPARLFCAIVGASSRARKGTSTDPVRRFFETVEKMFAGLVTPLRCSPGPLSSGEGIVFSVRDASDTLNEKGEPQDLGVLDKRLLVLEGELGAALSSIQRQGNTLSAILRTLWDSGTSAPMTKHSRIQTTKAHIGIVGHITRQELHELLRSSDVWNGFANRFLWIAARRQKLVPLPSPMDDNTVVKLSGQLAEALSKAKNAGRIDFTSEAEEKWRGIYPVITKDLPGVVGVVTSRAEAQVRRLALIYALLAQHDAIEADDLRAAIVAWNYCHMSAEFVFGTAAADPDHNKVLKELSRGAMSQTEISKIFGGNMSAQRLSSILTDLQSCGRITAKREGGGPGKGRPKTIWSVTKGFELADESLELDE